MGKLRDMVLPLDFENQPSHTIQFDPNVETESMNGRNGEYDVIRIKENGADYYLSLSNKSLVRQLQAITGSCKLRLTREGTSFATKYKVEKVT